MVPGKDTLMAKYNPLEFIQEVRQEVAKVTWPTWKEVWITTLMVLLMVSAGLGVFPHRRIMRSDGSSSLVLGGNR